jgi:hypothetical protein
MDAFQRTYERAANMVGRTKKKVQDTLGLHLLRSALATIESLTGDRAHSDSPSSHPRVSTEEATFRRDGISKGTTSLSNAAQRPRSELCVEPGGLEIGISRLQNLLDTTTSKQEHSTCNNVYINSPAFLLKVLK